MSALNLHEYSVDVGERYLKMKYGNYDRHSLPVYKKVVLRRIDALNDFQDAGAVLIRRKRKVVSFDGEIGVVMAELLTYRVKQGFAATTLQRYTVYLHQFLSYLTAHNICSVQMINISHIIAYINYFGKENSAIKHSMLSTIRYFFRFVYEHKLLAIDYSVKIPRDNYARQSNLPSVYSADEISALLEAIDRGNPKGKRDYAIILLAARLGLRSSDILNLKFENIFWKECMIRLCQVKTKRAIELPLSEDIGSAIIDYLKYARPISDLPTVFLRLIPPFIPVTSSAIAEVVETALRYAGIDYSQRKHGPHALRHSLLSQLLKDKLPLPVISEVLGHSSTESTMYYLRIDIDSLRQCALAVPPVNSTFYTRIQSFISSKDHHHD